MVRSDGPVSSELSRELSLFHITMMGLGMMLGAGVFLGIGNSIFVANILEEKNNGRAVLEIRNKIYAGGELEVLTPNGTISKLTLPKPLVTTTGEKVDFANNSQFVAVDKDLPAYTILRRITSSES